MVLEQKGSSKFSKAVVAGSFFFGKPLLHRFKALHDFDMDTVTVRSEHKSITLHNNVGKSIPATPPGISLTIDVEQQRDLVGGSSDVNPSLRQVPNTDILGFEVQNDKLNLIVGHTEVSLEVVDGDSMMTDDGIAREGEQVRTMEGDCIADNTPQENHGDEKNMGDQKNQAKAQDTDQGGNNGPPSREVQNQNHVSVETKEADDVCITALKHAARTSEDTEPAKSMPTCRNKPLKMEQRDLSGGSDKPPPPLEGSTHSPH